MPQVPAYTPVPDVTATDRPVPRIGVNAPPDAFGAAIAEGVGKLGQGLEQGGNDLYNTAYRLQQLDNEAQAKQADADYMIKAGELHANYSALEGQAAKDGYPKYVSDLEDLRRNIRDGLSNPMAQKMYDSTSLSTMGRTIFNGAGHAATETKKWFIGASKSRVQAIGDEALANPRDDDAFNQSLVKAEAETREQGRIAGKSSDEVDQDVATEKSTLWSKRIVGQARTQPILAKQMFDQAIQNGAIRGLQIGQVENVVNQGLYTQGARNLSHTINTGQDLYWGSKEVPIKMASMAIGTYESGNNYGLTGRQTAHGVALGKYQVMSDFLPDYLAKAGLPAMTPQEFLQNHAAQEQVFTANFGAAMKQYGNFNDAASVWFSGKPAAQAGNVSDVNGTTVPEYLRQTNAILAKNTSLADKVSRVRDMAQQIAPDTPLFQDYAQNRVESDFNQNKRIQLNDEYNNRQTIEGALMGGPDGKIPTTVDDLKVDPRVEKAWNDLPDSRQRAYLKVLKDNAKGDVAWSQDGLNEYQRLKGMAQADPADFLDQDVSGNNKLPFSARREMINLQGKLKANAESDPRVTKAMAIMQPDLFAAGFTKAKDPDAYYRFVGEMQDGIEAFQKDNKKPPKADDIRLIGTRLLQEHATSWLEKHITGGPPVFNVPVPDEEATKIKSDPYWASNGIVPTEQQVQRIYTRKLYQDLYGGKAKDANAAKVPASR